MALVLELASGSLMDFLVFKQQNEAMQMQPSQYESEDDKQGQLTKRLMTGFFGSCRERILMDIIKGMKHLHHEMPKPVMHRDIKVENVLRGEGHVGKLADFGESRIAEDGFNAADMTMVWIFLPGVY